MIKLLTDREVAQALRLSPLSGHKTVQQWAREKRIHGIRVGELWRFTEEAVNDFLKMGGLHD